MVLSWYGIGNDSRWVNTRNLLSRLGFDKLIVYEEANGLLVFPPVRGFEMHEQIRSHAVSKGRRVF